MKNFEIINIFYHQFNEMFLFVQVLKGKKMILITNENQFF
jgi:hypothetical protein